MLEADVTKLKCHAERLMSARHPATATIQVDCHTFVTVITHTLTSQYWLVKVTEDCCHVLHSIVIIQMTHDGECDVLKYVCPEVEMSTQGRTPSVDISTEGHIYLHVTQVHHASSVLSHH